MDDLAAFFSAPFHQYSVGAITALALIAFISAYVRAFAVFGLAMIAVPAFVHILPIDQAVLLAMAADAFVGVCLYIPLSRTPLHWTSIRPLTLAALPFIPLGAWGIQYVPAKIVYALIAILVFGATLALSLGYRAKENPDKKKILFAGTLSGLLGGALGISGPPVVLLYFSSPMGQHIGRASMMMYFLLVTFPTIFFRAGLSEAQTVWPLFFLLVPVISLAIYLGHGHFYKTDENFFRRVVYALLFGLALSSAVKAVT